MGKLMVPTFAPFFLSSLARSRVWVLLPDWSIPSRAMILPRNGLSAQSLVEDNNDSKSDYLVSTWILRIVIVMVDRAGFEPAAFRSVGLGVCLQTGRSSA